MQDSPISVPARDFTHAPGGDYNIVPYASMPFPQSQPSRLAGLAALFSLSPPAVQRARVLELGCASGGNIIPLAARFPEARFLGIDLSLRHVEEGCARITSLGLDNVEVRQGDLADAKLAGETFDYIVCHGVYSWVPPVAQDAILRLSSENLAANGVAYVSYNVYPGWQMRNIVRSMMIYHAGESGDPQPRIAKARWVLERIAKHSREGSPYGSLLRGEAKMLAGMDDSYILGEFLAPDNAPCTFREFSARADAHGLTYLCETEVNACIPENLGPEIGQLIRVMSGNGLIPLEQYIDYFMGRTFRQTLLVKSHNAKLVQRTLLPERVRHLPVSGQVTFSEVDSGPEFHVFRDAAGRTLTTRDKLVRAALERLGAAYPETRTVKDLVKEVSRPGSAREPGAEDRILDAVFKMVTAGLLTVSSEPVRAGRATAEKPVAWPIARADAAAGRLWTTSYRHEVVRLDPVSAALLPRMDGGRDRVSLEAQLLSAVRAGTIRLLDKPGGQPIEDAAKLDAAAREQVELAIGKLASCALLEAVG